MRSAPGRGSRAPASADSPIARGGAATKRAVGSSTAKPAERTASPRGRGGTSGPQRAPRGQTQAKVLAALSAAPGSTPAAVAKASGLPTATVSATILRLVKQERVRRLDEGDYAVVDASAGVPPSAAPAATAGQRDAETRAEPTAQAEPPAASPAAE